VEIVMVGSSRGKPWGGVVLLLRGILLKSRSVGNRPQARVHVWEGKSFLSSR